MTEDKAKTKWCPFVQIALDAAASRYATNRGEIITEGGPVNLKCIGSHCMAWRWTDPLTVSQKDRRGCCGLAGRP